MLMTNEFSGPFFTDTPKPVFGAMCRIFGEIRHLFTVPYGVETIADGEGCVEICAATGASFTRCLFTGAWAGDTGLQQRNIARTLRLRRELDLDDLKLCYFINGEGTTPMGLPPAGTKGQIFAERMPQSVWSFPDPDRAVSLTFPRLSKSNRSPGTPPFSVAPAVMKRTATPFLPRQTALLSGLPLKKMVFSPAVLMKSGLPALCKRRKLCERTDFVDRKKRCFMGIDVGTYESKGVLIDSDCRIICQASKSMGWKIRSPAGNRARRRRSLVEGRLQNLPPAARTVRPESG